LSDLLKPEPEMTDFLMTLVSQPHAESQPVPAHVNGY
jgi:hypothetical protein